MSIAVVCELVVGCRKFLETLSGYAREVTGEISVISQNHLASSHEAVDQRLLPHLFQKYNPERENRGFVAAEAEMSFRRRERK